MKKEIKTAIIILLSLLTIYFIVKAFLIDLTMIQGVSMFPTLEENQIVLVNKLKALTQKQPERYDLISFEIPSRIYVDVEEYTSEDLIAVYENNTFTTRTFTKRVIGLPGEHIQIKEDYKVYINDICIEEEYILDGTNYYSCAYIDLIIPEGTVFVMGDNRYDSIDSRNFGCIPIEKIKGYIIGF